MKFNHLCSVFFAVVQGLGQPQHSAALLDEQQGVELGAARIIHGIRGAEQALAKDLRGNPKLLLSEERLLHQASQLALHAGKMRAMQMHSKSKLNSIEATLMQSTAKGSSGAAQFDSLARKESQLLRGGRNILNEVHTLKTDFDEVLGQTEPEVTAKLQKLMDRVDGAQREILTSEAEATAHASKLADSIRKEKPKEKHPSPAVGVFTQASTLESSGTQDPVRRVKLAKKALSQLKVAKTEVAEAYGTDDGTAQKVEAMIDQLEGSLQGLEEGSEDDVKLNMKAEEAKMFANIERNVSLTVKASLAQESAHSTSSTQMDARRFHQQSRQLRRLAHRTRRLALEDRHISKETRVARRVIDRELGNTEVGEEVDALLTKAASEANRAAASDRRLVAVEKHEIHSLDDLADMLVH